MDRSDTPYGNAAASTRARRAGKDHGLEHPRSAFVLDELGQTALHMNDLREAESAFVHAVEGYGAAPGKHFQQGVRAVRHLAETFDATGRKSEADAVRTAFAAGPAPPSR